jgi:uncharacterized cupredoxin-like copper-binding protein
MPVLEKDEIANQTQTEHGFARPPGEMNGSSRSSSTSMLMLSAGLFAAAMILVGIVLATGAGDTSSRGAAGAAAAAPAKRAVAPTAPTPAARIAVRLKEFTITPTPTVGRAGRVTFSVHNAGTMRHEFVVLRTNKAADALLKGKEADEAGNVGEIPDLAPDATKTLRLTLKAGHYALICNLAGHYVAGQHVDFTVR